MGAGHVLPGMANKSIVGRGLEAAQQHWQANHCSDRRSGDSVKCLEWGRVNPEILNELWLGVAAKRLQMTEFELAISASIPTAI